MKKGIHFALALALISGVSIFLNSFAVKQIPNAFFFTTAKNLIVAFLLVALLILFKRFGEIKKLSKKDWIFLILLGLVGGSIPFLLFFKGLSVSIAAAINGAFIHKTLFIWVALLALIFLKERFSIFQYFALLIILSGIYLMGGLKSIHFGRGEILIILATLLWSAEAILAKKILKNIDFQIAAFGRMFFGSLIMISYLLITHNLLPVFKLTTNQIEWIIITSLLLLGYVIFYYGALNYTPATIVTSVLTLGFPITVILQGIYLGAYSFKQILGGTVIITGAILFFLLPKLINKIKKQDLVPYGRG